MKSQALLQQVLLLVLICVISHVHCADRGLYSVKGDLRKTVNPSDTRVQLRGSYGEFSAIPRIDGSFVIRDVQPGVYLFDVVSIRYNFSTIRVDVSAKHNGKVRARYLNDTTTFIQYPLSLEPTFTYQFLQKRQPYDFYGSFRNLAIGVGVIAVMFFLIKNIDMDAAKDALRSLQAPEGEQSTARPAGSAQEGGKSEKTQ